MTLLKHIFPDNAAKRKILDFKIKCPSKGCDWIGELSAKKVILIGIQKEPVEFSVLKQSRIYEVISSEDISYPQLFLSASKKLL